MRKKQKRTYIGQNTCDLPGTQPLLHSILLSKPLKTNSHSCPRKIATSWAVVFPGYLTSNPSISTQKESPENGGRIRSFQRFVGEKFSKENNQAASNPPKTTKQVPRTALGTAVDTVLRPGTFIPRAKAVDTVAQRN